MKNANAVKPVYVGHLCFHSTRPTYTDGRLMKNPLDTIKAEMWTIACPSVQFRAKRQVVKLESSYTTLSMNSDFNYNYLPLENSN
jgi:hypothetical protein